MKSKASVRQEYLAQVTIIEARNLATGDTGICDPFVRVTVSGSAPQVTTTKFSSSNCVFNQSFTFPNIWMNAVEFESFEIKLEVFDLSNFGRNRLVGTYSIGLSTLFRNPDHEIYNQWLMLTLPDKGLEPQGYILCNAYIISSEDRPPVHDMNDKIEEEPDEFGGKPDDQLTAEELQRRRERKKQMAVLKGPEVIRKPYQLIVNIYKAEDLPIMSFGSCDSFISVRAGGITQVTSVMKNMQKPQYATRLCFPLYFPVLNDKIVIRVWDKRVCMTDTFIGMVPEVPQENDFFSVNFLQSRGGVMPFRWFNLYGIPVEERPSNFEQMFLGYKRKLLGTDYLGRICLSLNLTPSEKPEKIVKPLNTFKEPEVKMYLCRIDFYEVQGAKDCGEFITIQVKVGPLLIKSHKADAKKNTGKNDGALSYVWGEKSIALKESEQKVELPSDPIQVPDMFVSLYDSQNKRQAYIRIPYHFEDLEKPEPKWYTLQCVMMKNASEGQESVPHSQILINAMLRPERIAVKRNVSSQYKFHAWIWGGYDLCPDSYSEEVQVSFEVVQNTQFIPPVKLNKPIQGKNPIWNLKFTSKVTMDENLQFAGNIIVQFVNQRKTSKWFDDSFMGEVCIYPFNSLIPPQEKEFDIAEFKPDFKYWRIVSREGVVVGRILAAFHLERLKQNVRVVFDNQTIVPIFENTQFKQMNLQIPIFGVRKLPVKLKKPIINLRVPIPASLVENKQNSEQSTLDCYSNQSVEFQTDQSEQGWFSQGIQDPNFLKLVELYVWVPPELKFWPQIEIELRDLTNVNEKFIAVTSLILLAKGKTALELAEAIRFYKEGLQEEQEESKPQNNETTTNGTTTENINNQGDIKNENDKEQKKEDKPSKQSLNQKRIPIQQENKNIQQQSEIQKLLKIQKVYNVIVEQQIEIAMTQEDLSEVEKQSTWKVSRLKDLLKTYKKDSQFDSLKVLVKREIEKNTNFKIDEDNFFGISKDDDEGGGQFDYGRRVLKGPYENEEIKKRVPFKRYELYQLSTSKQSGILGTRTNSYIKGDMKLVEKSFSQQTQSFKSGDKSIAIKKSSLMQHPSKKKDVQTSLSNLEQEFSLFNQNFLNFFNKPLCVKVRVYLLRCLNLAAQAQNIDTNHMLAGMTAYCDANPFPEIIIGEGNSKSTDLIKFVYQADSAIKNSLSPEFFQMYELDAELPTDWKMTINIRNKGLVDDSIIGSVEINLEDRLVGEQLIKERIGFMVLKHVYQEELDELKFIYTPEAESKKKKLQSTVNNLTQKIDNFDKDRYSVPVEYCELKKSGQTQTSQGTIEMFIEVLPVDIAREIPPSPMQRPEPQQYEVRLIVLETFKIPLNPKKNNTVDIFVKVSMDSTATGNDEEVGKETDTHLGSKDGDGVFNWRMKFPFIWPCPFPRMKLSVYDMNSFSSDECLGEATISLRRLTNQLSIDGNYTMPPTKIKLSLPNSDQDRGEVYIQLKVVTKQIAENSPVGDAQDEPNEDPYLERPTVGRGLADFFASSGGGRGIMFYIKVIGGIVLLLLVILVLFVKPGILVN